MPSAGLEQSGNSHDKGSLLLIQCWHLLCLYSVVAWDCSGYNEVKDLCPENPDLS